MASVTCSERDTNPGNPIVARKRKKGIQLKSIYAGKPHEDMVIFSPVISITARQVSATFDYNVLATKLIQSRVSCSVHRIPTLHFTTFPCQQLTRIEELPPFVETVEWHTETQGLL